MEAVECGAAALGIVLGYHGRIVPLEELRVACGVSRDGSKASNIVKAGRAYGMIAKGFKKEPDELRSLKPPFIVFWNFDHFLVVEGFGKKGVYLNDPASGRRVVTYEEFDQAYTGVVLTFEPGPDFRKGGARPSLLAAMRRRLRGSGWALAFVVLASLALIVPGIVIPIFSQVFIDQYLVRGSQSIIGPLLIGMLLTAFLRAALTWLQQHYLLRLQTKLAVGMSSTLFWHTLRLPVEFYTQRYAGEVGSRVTVNDRIAQLLSGQVATAALNVLTVLFYVVVMLQYDITLTLIGVFFAALNFVALRFVSRQRIDTNQRLLMERGKLTGVSMSGLQTIETLKATGSESDFFVRWAGLQAKLVEAQQQLGTSTQIVSGIPTMLTALATAVVLGVGALRVMSGDLTIGMLVAFQSLMVELHDARQARWSPSGPPCRRPGAISNRAGRRAPLRDGPAGAGQDLRRRSRASGHAGGAVGAPSSCRNLTFGYSRLEPPLIEDFDLTLEPGSRVALVGPSGSGKSTVAKLVTGLYQPWEGEILFDGWPRAEVPARSAHLLARDGRPGHLPVRGHGARQPHALGHDHPGEARIVQAAKDAGIHDDITARPAATRARSRRAAATSAAASASAWRSPGRWSDDPTLLVLDEATSALDPTTESVIDDNLRRRGCTCLIVAHRLSTIRDCDEIIVLDRGKVVQRGTHEEMRDVEGPYASLIEAQAHQDGHAG